MNPHRSPAVVLGATVPRKTWIWLAEWAGAAVLFVPVPSRAAPETPALPEGWSLEGEVGAQSILGAVALSLPRGPTAGQAMGVATRGARVRGSTPRQPWL